MTTFRSVREVDDRDWAELDQRVGGRLLRVRSPLEACRADPSSPECVAALESLRNPFFHEDEPGAFQTTGWLGAYDAAPSPYAVAATSAADIAAAVRFAREHDLRIVVKGTGHDYLGRSSAPDALLVWTHPMRSIELDDDASVPTVTVGAGTRWLEVYQAATARGRYVLGGGCTSVGAAGGFTQGGGFGSFSKRFGTAAGNVVEIEVVTADGEIVVANDHHHPDLFWALRGGGGGTFGVVSKVTMLTHAIPATVGVAIGTISAHTPDDYRRLVREFLTFFGERLNNEHWGEQFRLSAGDSIEVALTMLDLSEDEGRAAWAAFLDWLARHEDAYRADIQFAALPFETFWDASWWDQNVPDFIRHDDRPGQPRELFWWASNQEEVSQYLDSYQSRWLPRALFEGAGADRLADALVGASRHWPVTVHVNKGLAGAAPDAVERDRRTAINPAAFDAAALVIMASKQQYAYADVPGREPDRDAGAVAARKIDAAMRLIRDATPGAGSYLNETNYFEPDWQRSFWGANYPRLLEIKQRYDPTNRFRVHHGVGSDD